MPTTILTIFAGRKMYMHILMKYVRCLLDRGIIDECHLWDYTRNFQDYKYLLAECTAHREGRGVVTLMSVQNKGSWREYYDHYAVTYGHLKDLVVIKCDDDIVYLDIDTFPAFIAFRVAHPEHLFTFPTIINNGIVAHMQQHQPSGYPNSRCRLAPAGTEGCPHVFERKLEGFESLVKDGKKAAWLHTWFLEALGRVPTGAQIRTPSDAHVLLALQQRISINFFAVLSQDLKLFAPEGGISDDEYYLTQVLPSMVKRPNSVYTDMTVSHFAFCTQRDTGLDGCVESVLLQRYDALAVWPAAQAHAEDDTM